MKYEKNQYVENISFCGAVIAGAFIFWGISMIITGSWGGYILLIMGAGCLGSQIYKFAMKDKLRNVVKFEFERNPKASVEDICNATGFSKKDVQAIILDLKGSGELRGSFSSKTGELKAIQKDIEESKIKFCQNCGTKIEKTEAQFCNYCGAKLD